jgi:hypothetical protein
MEAESKQRRRCAALAMQVTRDRLNRAANKKSARLSSFFENLQALRKSSLWLFAYLACNPPLKRNGYKIMPGKRTQKSALPQMLTHTMLQLI